MADGLATLPAGQPELTLGWEAIAWAGKYLKHANGLRAGLPFRFTMSQVRFLLWFYAVNDEGRWLYDRGARRWPKGSGKSPFAGVHGLTEMLGPVRLADWDPKAPGGCVGKSQPMAYVQIAATTLSQTANTMRSIRQMAALNTRVTQEYGLDVGKTRINGPGGSMLEVITSSASAAEGAECTFGIADETEHWNTSNGGHELVEVLERNLGKTGSRLVETCNAWQPGEFSVAEDTFDTWELQQQGRTRGESRILYDARLPNDVDLTDGESLMRGLRFAYGDTADDVEGGWAPLRDIQNTIWNGKTRADTARRFYLNQPTASVDAWVARHEWEALADVERTVADKEDVVLFFDGSKSNDATALIGCCMSDGHVFTVGIWEPDPNDKDDEVDAYDVDAAVEIAFEKYSVLGFFADVREWESFVKTSWPDRHRQDLLISAVPTGKQIQPIAWDMRSHTTEFMREVELVEAEIIEKKFTHDGDERVARHVANARRWEKKYGTTIGKESRSSSRKVDAAVCVIGARMVRRQVLASDAYKKRSRKSTRMVVW